MNRTRLVGLFVLTLGGLGGLVGCSRSAATAPAEAQAAEEPAASSPVPVHVARAIRATLRPSIDLVGVVAAIPEHTADVCTRVEGQIARVAVIEGQAVAAGEPLIELDDRLAQSRLARATAAARRAAATLERLQNGPRKEEIEAARQDARRLAAVAHALRAKLDALQPLRKQGEVSDVEYRQMQAQAEAAAAEASAAAARLKLLQAGSRPEDIAAARAELAEAQAGVTAAKLAVEFCTIRSPRAGVVAQLSARAGASVAPGDTLARILDTSEFFVRVRVPDARLDAVRAGAPADVTVGSGQDAPTRGRVARLSPLADDASGGVDAFVSVANDGGLRPGLACRVRIWLPELAGALVIPVEAVADRNGVAVVTVIRDNKAYEQPVRLGATTAKLAQVLEGLSAGDLVATEGGYGLPEGCPVRVVETPAADRRPSQGE